MPDNTTCVGYRPLMISCHPNSNQAYIFAFQNHQQRSSRPTNRCKKRAFTQRGGKNSFQKFLLEKKTPPFSHRVKPEIGGEGAGTTKKVLT